MPLGTFLDSMPALLFIAAHVLFLGVAIWAAQASAPLFWLYAVSQVIFLAFFGGLITMKMGVLVEGVKVDWPAVQKHCCGSLTTAVLASLMTLTCCSARLGKLAARPSAPTTRYRR